jgi:hypothetical protein
LLAFKKKKGSPKNGNHSFACDLRSSAVGRGTWPHSWGLPGVIYQFCEQRTFCSPSSKTAGESAASAHFCYEQDKGCDVCIEFA